jgi:hypothetical protein
MYRGYFPGVKWPKPEVDPSPPTRGKVTNDWSYTSAAPPPPVLLNGVKSGYLTFLIMLVAHDSLQIPITVSETNSPAD